MDLYPIKKAKKNEEEEATIDARYESKNMIIYLMSDNDQNILIFLVLVLI